MGTDGFIGLGTDNPGTKLQLFGAAAQEIRVTYDAATDHSLRLEQNASGTFIGGYDSTNTQAFAFRAYNYSHFSNSLGIGVTVPSYKLDVAGTGHFSSHVTTEGDITIGRGTTTGKQAYHDLYIGGNGLGGADSAIYIGNGGDGTGYGWELYYYGVGSGNSNTFILQSENLGTKNKVFECWQSGNITFYKDVTISGALAANGGISMNNTNLTGVNHIVINDAGVGEGIEWSGGNGWKIYESPDNLTNAAGNLQFVTGSTRRITMSTAGTLTAQGDVVAYSDERVKENIETIPNALEIAKQLRGVKYNRTDVEDKSEKIGVIAQEVQKVLPQVVHEQGDGLLGVSYGNIVSVLIEAIKEQQEQIDELKRRLDGNSTY